MKNKIWSLVAFLLLSLKMGAQVIYTDTTIVLNSNNEVVLLNIDNDTSGVNDFAIRQFVDTAVTGSGPNAILANGSFVERAELTAVIAGLPAGGTYYPFNINLGEAIDSGTVFKGLDPIEGYGQLALKVNDTVLVYDKFHDTAGITNGFIGLRFIANKGDSITTHYGYIQVSLPANLRSITIKGFAYESRPEVGILAGAGSGLLGHEHYPIPASWALRAIDGGVSFQKKDGDAPREVNLRILSLSGQLITETELNAESHFYSLQHLPKGLYLAVAQTPNGARKVLKVRR